jgi:hypothetical protein
VGEVSPYAPARSAVFYSIVAHEGSPYTFTPSSRGALLTSRSALRRQTQWRSPLCGDTPQRPAPFHVVRHSFFPLTPFPSTGVGYGLRKTRPYNKWAFTIKQTHGVLGNFVNSLRSDRTEVASKTAHVCFVNAAICPDANFAQSVTDSYCATMPRERISRGD